MTSTDRSSAPGWLLLAACVALAFFRAPELLLEPRLWAEEGESFYQYAYHVGFLDGLLYAERYSGGYFLLVATLPAALVAHLLPVEAAAAGFTAWAMAILLLPFAIILFGTSHVWNSFASRAVACTIVLFAPTAIGEVWLNVTNAQIYLGLASVCILCEDFREAGTLRLAVLCLLLVFAGLSGPYTAFLVPAFLCKWSVERTPGAMLSAAAVVVSAAIQFLVFLELAASGLLHESKMGAYDWVQSAAHTVYAQFLAPILGRELPLVLASWFGIDERVLAGSVGLVHALIGVMAVAGILLGLWLLWPRSLRSMQSVLWVALVGLAVGTTLGAKSGIAGGRYAVLPGFTLLFLLLASARLAPGNEAWRARIATLLLCVSMAIGVWGYREDPAFACREPCPRWADEVARWRQDPGYRMQIWPVHRDRPGSRWVVALVPGGPPPPPGTVPELEGVR